MKRFVPALLLGAALAGGCSGTTFGAIANMTAGETENVSVSMDTLFPSLSATQRASIDPFSAHPVTWERIGLTEVDAFSQSAAELYGSVLALQRVVEEGTAWRANPSYNVAGYQDVRSLANAGQTVATSAPARADELQQTGQRLAQNISDIARGEPMLIPKASTEIGEGLQRINESQRLLRDLTPQLQGLVTGN